MHSILFVITYKTTQQYLIRISASFSRCHLISIYPISNSLFSQRQSTAGGNRVDWKRPPSSQVQLLHPSPGHCQTVTNNTWLTPTLSNHKVKGFPLTYRSLIQAGVAPRDSNSSLKQAPPASMGIRPERWIATIPSSDQWLATIGNHWKTIMSNGCRTTKPLNNHWYQWFLDQKPLKTHWNQWLPDQKPMQNHWY